MFLKTSFTKISHDAISANLPRFLIFSLSRKFKKLQVVKTRKIFRNVKLSRSFRYFATTSVCKRNKDNLLLLQIQIHKETRIILYFYLKLLTRLDRIRKRDSWKAFYVKFRVTDENFIMRKSIVDLHVTWL